MAETLLNQLLNDETDPEDFFGWLTQLNQQDEKFSVLTAKYQCSRTDFITFFLNFIHEDVASAISEKKSELEETRSSTEINRSHSFPLDLSSELDESATSTPKINKVFSESSVSYMSPVSPIYKCGLTTPKNGKPNEKSGLCLGDFIVNGRISSKKRNKRIKPTSLNETNSFHKSENSFNFNKSEIEEFPVERDGLVEEKLRILSRNQQQSLHSSPKKVSRFFSGEIHPDLESVSHKKQIELIVRIYVDILNNNFALNLTSELYFLVSLLLKKQYYSVEWGIEVLCDKITARGLFRSIHNVVFFVAKSLEQQLEVLACLDNSTLRLLRENRRLQLFSPVLIEKLQNVEKPDRIIDEPTQNNICFNSDTDNRQNFPNDFSFHAFRKQRDLFYEILRIWEIHHSAPNFNYSLSLGGKIRTLLSLSREPTNFIHFARLFKSQLSTCRSESTDFFTSLDVDVEKLNKLKSRCVTKGSCQGLNSLPIFSEVEEFFKEFILVGGCCSFNRHLSDILIEEITDMNENTFGCNDLDADVVTKKTYFSCVKNLRTLAKFLGFLESLPYKTEIGNYSETLLETHLRIRRQVQPSFDVKTILENSIRRKSVTLCIPWLVKYLSMLDNITLKLPYYVRIQTNLFWLYRNFSAPTLNTYLVKFSLGWFFELPHIPNNNYLQFCTETSQVSPTNLSVKFCLDDLELVDHDILYFCCPYLNEIKKLLLAQTTNHSISVKHITPVTALQSPDELARKKLEQQLEESFFNGQPISLRKTVEFVSERVASACVKYVCHTLVPRHKKTALERFQSLIEIEEDVDVETQKAALRLKANELAVTCMRDLRKCSETEVETISGPKISQAIDSLLASDILPQTKQVCIGITKKTCFERVKQWIDGHVTSSVFTKDFNDEIERVTSSDVKKPKKPVFMLPPSGTKSKHNEEATSGAHLVEKLRLECVKIIEKKDISMEEIVSLLDDVSLSIEERCDLNQCILATICTQILDLVVLLLAHDWKIAINDQVLSKSCDIWKLYYNGCDDLFKSLLSPRNVKIFSRSSDPRATWDSFAKLCAHLIKRQLLSCDVFESQCTGIFRTEWDQSTLKHVTDFFKTFAEMCREHCGNADDLTFLIDFFSDYCEDLF